MLTAVMRVVSIVVGSSFVRAYVWTFKCADVVRNKEKCVASVPPRARGAINSSVAFAALAAVAVESSGKSLVRQDRLYAMFAPEICSARSFRSRASSVL